MLLFAPDFSVFKCRIRLERREESLLEDVLSRVSRLVTLKLHTVCNDSMLKMISLTCHCLSSLDISFSKHVTDRGIEDICASQTPLQRNLREILLDGTSISSKAVLCLLENFPALFTLDSALMEKFLLSMQEFFKESSILGGQSGTLSIHKSETI